MPQNRFSPKMRKKSSQELQLIIGDKNYSLGGQEAARYELEIRESSGKHPGYTGEWQYEDFLSELRLSNTLLKEHTYQEVLDTNLDHATVLKIAQKIFAELDWKILQLDKEFVLGMRRRNQSISEKVAFVKNAHNEILVFSQSEKYMFFRPKSKRNMEAVKLAIYVFNELAEKREIE